jgi:ATP-binding cassette subfamily B protein
MDPEIVDPPDAVAMDLAAMRGSVRFRDVSFRYPTEAVPSSRAQEAMAAGANGLAATVPALELLPAFALDRVSFEAQPGELVALVGPSGAGKTTTTDLIPRLYDVDSGSVEIDDMDVRRIKLKSLGEIIGVVTQETYLFHASVRTNLLYARPEATDAELEAAPRAAAI